MENPAIKENPAELIPYLHQFITDQRWEIIQKVLEYRTRYITVVLEDIYQSQNASAVLRSCECFGIQDVHIIENRHEYQINPDVTQGSNKWLNLHKYNHKPDNTLDAIHKLKGAGYRIIATTPHTHEISLHQFDIEKGKFALFFGTEVYGLSDKVMKNADEFIKIPMFGFTESFNISVSAAMVLSTLVKKLHDSDIDWKLQQNERDEILYDWLKKSIRRPKKVVEEFYKRKNPK